MGRSEFFRLGLGLRPQRSVNRPLHADSAGTAKAAYAPTRIRQLPFRSAESAFRLDGLRQVATSEKLASPSVLLPTRLATTLKKMVM